MMQKELTIMKKISFIICFLFLFSLFFTSNVFATSTVKINKTKMSVCVGSKKRIKILNYNGKVKWKSKNHKIATVSSTGTIKGKKKGKTTVWTIVNRKKMKCKVTVYNKLTPEQAKNKVKKKWGKGYGYFIHDPIIKYKGKEYYLVYLKFNLGDHYSLATKYFVSLDGTVCREGDYYNGVVEMF